MDAGTILENVAATYATLETLDVELLITTESDDGEAYRRSEERASAFFVAPNKLRIQHGGRRGMVLVMDGVDRHTYFGALKRYMRFAFSQDQPLPGSFDPELPIVSGVTFLFSRIAERIATAEFLRDDPAIPGDSGVVHHVLSVTYRASPQRMLLEPVSPLLFWVDSKTHLIARMEAEGRGRPPGQEDAQTSKFTLLFTRRSKNQEIPPETFDYSPPADTLPSSDTSPPSGCFISTGRGPFEVAAHFQWAGETLIERSKFKVRSLDIEFEKSMTLSDDQGELRVVERIAGPKGETQRDFVIPLD